MGYHLNLEAPDNHFVGEGDHYRPCPVCKKLVLVKCLSGGPRCCSSECAVKLRNDTCINKFCSMII